MTSLSLDFLTGPPTTAEVGPAPAALPPSGGEGSRAFDQHLRQADAGPRSSDPADGPPHDTQDGPPREARQTQVERESSATPTDDTAATGAASDQDLSDNDSTAPGNVPPPRESETPADGDEAALAAAVAAALAAHRPAPLAQPATAAEATAAPPRSVPEPNAPADGAHGPHPTELVEALAGNGEANRPPAGPLGDAPPESAAALPFELELSAPPTATDAATALAAIPPAADEKPVPVAQIADTVELSPEAALPEAAAPDSPEPEASSETAVPDTAFPDTPKVEGQAIAPTLEKSTGDPAAGAAPRQAVPVPQELRTGAAPASEPQDRAAVRDPAAAVSPVEAAAPPPMVGPALRPADRGAASDTVTGSSGDSPGAGSVPPAETQGGSSSGGQQQSFSGRSEGMASPAATRVGEPAADPQRLLDRVARALEAASLREGPVRLRLSPPELGSMRIEISVREGGVEARLEVETHAARQALVEHLPALRERLAEHHLKIERFEVGLMGEAFAGLSGGSREQYDPNFGAVAGRPRIEGVEESDEAVVPTAMFAAGRLNIVV